MPAWKSPSALEPSPIQVDATWSSPLIAAAIAQPTAWMYWVPRLPAMVKKPCARDVYITGSCRPFTGSRGLEKS